VYMGGNIKVNTRYGEIWGMILSVSNTIDKMTTRHT
jgi:hypothetical protein